MRTNNRTHRYEFGSATVFVVCPLGTDGLIRQKYQVSIHPVGGGAVIRTQIPAFFAWDAANQAVKILKQTQR